MDQMKYGSFIKKMAEDFATCVWMRESKKMKCYEYIATYVDDLCIAAQDPGKIIQTLKEDYKLKVKGDGPLSHDLGADYTRDKDKTLVCQ